MKFVALTATDLGSAFRKPGMVCWFKAKPGAPKAEFPMVFQNVRFPGAKVPLLCGQIHGVDASRGTFRGVSDHGHGGDIKIEHCLFCVEAL